LAPRNLEKEQTVLVENEPAKTLIFLENGVVDVNTHFEQNDFRLEALHAGSVIN
jgi:hypothetical protein